LERWIGADWALALVAKLARIRIMTHARRVLWIMRTAYASESPQRVSGVYERSFAEEAVE
jgi:hypothetical protein